MTPLLFHISELLTAACVAGLWQGVALAAMGAAMCAMMPRASAGLRHTILIALFAGALILPLIHFHHPVGAVQSQGLLLAPWVAAGIALLWGAAVVIRAGQLYLAWRHLCAVRRDATPIEVLGFAEVHGGRRHAVLCSSPDVDSPSILGFGSPRLLLPDWMVPLLSEAELQQIALHESEHLRRGDDWMNLLLQAGIMLFPLNPALLWLNRRIGIQRELAVDAAVVAHTAQPLTYASCLTRLAEQRRARGRLRLALAAWERRSELMQRVHVLLDRPSVWTRRQSACAAGAAAAALLLAATGMARVPQLVHMDHGPIQTASDQAPATVVPMIGRAAMSQARHADGAYTAQIVPVSFHVKPRSSAGLQVKRKKKLAGKRSDALPDLKALETRQSDNTDRMVRARYVLPRRTYTARGNATRMAGAPLRLITAESYSPYVAVPTSNGWLFIEL